jgi:O-antigen/teichoic acid export membrane protein
MKALIERYRRSKLAKNTGWMLLGQGLNTAIRAFYFVAIARSLGSQEYGAFMAVVAATSIFKPYVGIGCEYLLVKNVSRNRAVLDEYLGNGLLLVVLTALAFTGVVISICQWILPSSISWSTIALLCLADLLCARISDLVAFAFGSLEKLRNSALINTLASLSRLLGIALTIAIVPHPSARLWSAVYAIAAGLVTAASLFMARQIAECPRFALYRIPRELREGFLLSAGQSAQTVYNDVDKTMIVRLSTLDANGIYTAAYRLVDMSLLPVTALLGATYPRFFRQGQSGINATYGYAKELIPRATGYALFAAGCVFTGAPIIPRILGPEYLRTVEAIRWLALLPVLKSVHFFLADALTGAGHQGTRLTMQAVVACFNIVVNLWLISAYSWRGAAWSSIASDGLLAVLMWSAISVLRRPKRAARVAESA